MGTVLPSSPGGDLSIVICGAAGQGLQTVETLGAAIFKRMGLHVFATKEFMSRVRGGSNSSQLRLSELPVRALVDRIDLLICLNRGLRDNVIRRISKDTLVIADPEEMGGEAEGLGGRFVPFPILSMARSSGGPALASSVVLGLMGALVGVQWELLEREVRGRFAAKGEKVLSGNLKAAQEGFHGALGLKSSEGIVVNLVPRSSLSGRLLMSGNDGVFMGAIAGGCDFVTAYPMSPGSGVLHLMAQHARAFRVAVEQAEDEIAAANMVLGAWYAGARAMATTSGGGFALMCEAVSLCGVSEVPMVVHIGQRPGPATGMATRTEQADLNLALYAGHGEFPRAIFTPGDVEEAFHCTRAAFEVADQCQVPAFVLTDQYLLDSSHDLDPFSVGHISTNWVVETSSDYGRYRITPDGISPRGVPGLGEGLVCVDSHEHDEWGHMKEDFQLRVRMTRKRLAKEEVLRARVMPPVFNGPSDAPFVVVGWGSTKEIVREAISSPELEGRFCQVHLPQVWPLPLKALRDLIRDRRVVVLEGNATGQLDALLRIHGICSHGRINHFSGLQMPVEDAVAALREMDFEGGA